MMQKGQALIFIILAIVAAAFVGTMFYVAKQTPNPPPQVATSTPSPTPSPSPIDETSNWKTYESPIGFQVKYPPNEVETSVSGGSYGSVIFYRKDLRDVIGDAYLYTTGEYFGITFDYRDASSPNQGVDAYTNEKTKIAGYDALKGSAYTECCVWDEYYFIFSPDGKRTVRVGLKSVKEEGDSRLYYLDRYRQVLSTFRFLE